MLFGPMLFGPVLFGPGAPPMRRRSGLSRAPARCPTQGSPRFEQAYGPQRIGRAAVACACMRRRTISSTRHAALTCSMEVLPTRRFLPWRTSKPVIHLIHTNTVTGHKHSLHTNTVTGHKLNEYDAPRTSFVYNNNNIHVKPRECSHLQTPHTHVTTQRHLPFGSFTVLFAETRRQVEPARSRTPGLTRAPQSDR